MSLRIGKKRGTGVYGLRWCEEEEEEDRKEEEDKRVKEEERKRRKEKRETRMRKRDERMERRAESAKDVNVRLKKLGNRMRSDVDRECREKEPAWRISWRSMGHQVPRDPHVWIRPNTAPPDDEVEEEKEEERSRGGQEGCKPKIPGEEEQKIEGSSIPNTADRELTEEEHKGKPTLIGKMYEWIVSRWW